jgi:hypothetical protein
MEAAIANAKNFSREKLSFDQPADVGSREGTYVITAFSAVSRFAR